jgi:hypothetical protein
MADQPSPASRSRPTFWTGQATHFIGLPLLLLLTWIAWQFVGNPSPVLFWIAIASPIIHQIFVWFTWRLELQASSTLATLTFPVYLAIFFTLFASRFVSLLTLAWVTRGSLQLPIIPQVILTTLFTVPGVYAMYSVVRYFGLARAAGADHFDPRYRDMPLVRQGIFRFTSNGMYLYAFFLFWAIALAFNSIAATIVAAFSHAYIWVHYYATEKPDMDYLYRASSRPETD